jgi:hypothetical protein
LEGKQAASFAGLAPMTRESQKLEGTLPHPGRACLAQMRPLHARARAHCASSRTCTAHTRLSGGGKPAESRHRCCHAQAHRAGQCACWRQPNMERERHLTDTDTTTGLFGGRGWACFARSSGSWPSRGLRATPS